MKLMNLTSSKSSVAWAGIAAAGLLTGCSDPADDVAHSNVGGAKETGAAPAGARQYTIADSSSIGFVGSKVTGSHEGGFKQFSGTLFVADGALVSGSSIEIDMASTWADNNRLAGHLKSADFFDVANHPISTFLLTGTETSGTQTTLTGNLGLHGVTNSISFPADVLITDQSVTVKAEFAINRKDFNINYPGKPNDLIRDNVVLKLDVTAEPTDD